MEDLIWFIGILCSCGLTCMEAPVRRDFLDRFEAVCPHCHELGRLQWRELQEGEAEAWFSVPRP